MFFVLFREEGWFNLMLVQHTQQIIIMPHKKIGEKVNLEVDVAGKYAAAASQVCLFLYTDYKGQKNMIVLFASHIFCMITPLPPPSSHLQRLERRLGQLEKKVQTTNKISYISVTVGLAAILGAGFLFARK